MVWKGLCFFVGLAGQYRSNTYAKVQFLIEEDENYFTPRQREFLLKGLMFFCWPCCNIYAKCKSHRKMVHGSRQDKSSSNPSQKKRNYVWPRKIPVKEKRPKLDMILLAGCYWTCFPLGGKISSSPRGTLDCSFLWFDLIVGMLNLHSSFSFIRIDKDIQGVCP